MLSKTKEEYTINRLLDQIDFHDMTAEKKKNLFQL